MVVRKLFRKVFALKYKYRLPLIYLLIILASWATLLVPPLNDCSGGFGVFCLPLSAVSIILVGIPGRFVIHQLDFVIPRKFFSWETHSENLWSVVFIYYTVALITFFLLGLLIDKFKERVGKK